MTESPRVIRLTDDDIERLQEGQRRVQIAPSAEYVAARRHVLALAAGTDAMIEIAAAFREQVGALGYDRTATDRAALAVRWAALADRFAPELSDDEVRALTAVYDQAVGVSA
ncbi:hypothetical protein GCM10027416_03230 [Okibacterium endophyticum]